jgi:hypothetical protein
MNTSDSNILVTGNENFSVQDKIFTNSFVYEYVGTG